MGNNAAQVPVGTPSSINKSANQPAEVKPPLLPKPKFSLPSKKIILIITVLILALILLGLCFFKSKELQNILRPKSQKVSQFIDAYKNETSSLNFPGQHWRSKFSDNLSQALSEKDSAKQFELFSNNFDILKWMYADSHDSSTRQSALNLSEFLKKEYSKEYEAKAKQFDIPCLDSSCTTISPPADVQEIIALVKEAKFRDPLSKKSILNKLDTAVLVTDENQKFNIYNAAFLEIRSEWDVTKEPGVKKVGEKILELIQKNYPEQYKVFKDRGTYELK
jgi:hypothetical protein